MKGNDLSILKTNWEETKAKFVDGVIWYDNPHLSVIVSQHGNVLDRRTGVELKPTQKGMYNIRYSTDWNYMHPVKVSSIMCHILGVVKKHKFESISLIDQSKGWVHGNIASMPCRFFEKNKTEEHESISLDDLPLFKVVVKRDLWLTEDGAEFPTEELAKWHQKTVDLGKSNAQIVLDYNGGHVLAEQVFLNSVVYNRPKPYEHFVQIMKNDDGVKHKAGDKFCVFSKSGVLEGISLDKDKQYTAEEANKIVQHVNLIKSLRGQLKEII